MHLKHPFLIAIWSFCGSTIFGQLPNTHLFTLDMKANEIKVVLENPKWLTSFNSDGYNNQPSFRGSDHLLFTSSWKAGGLTDIYQFDLSSQNLTRLTATEESEYSPTPSADGTSFFVVRQEVTDSSRIPQVLWKYPSDLTHFGEIVTNRYDNIGYFKFLAGEKIALFLVGPPNKLVVFDLSTGEETFVSYNIGRALKLDKEGNLIYVQKLGNTAAIRKFELTTGKSNLITYTPDGLEDFELLPNGDLVAGNNSLILRYSLSNRGEWEELIDLSSYRISNITRISASRNKIAFVASR